MSWPLAETHKPKLETEADWVAAGEIVFGTPIGIAVDRRFIGLADVRSSAWYEHSGMPITLRALHHSRERNGRIGIIFLRNVPHTCHAPGGSIIKGA